MKQLLTLTYVRNLLDRFKQNATLQSTLVQNTSVRPFKPLCCKEVDTIFRFVYFVSVPTSWCTPCVLSGPLWPGLSAEAIVVLGPKLRIQRAPWRKTKTTQWKKFRFQSGGRSKKNEIILIQKFDMRFDLFYCKYPRTQDKLESAKLKALSTGISRWKCIEQEIFRLKRSKREGNFFVKPNL